MGNERIGQSEPRSGVARALPQWVQAGFLFVCVTLLCTIVLLHNYDILEIGVGDPLTYSGDNFSMLALIKQISQSFNWWYNPYLGGEYGQVLSAYPFFDSLSFAIVFAISRFASDPILIYNLFYYLTYYLCAYAALYVLLKLHVHPALSVAAAVLFSFLAFHTMRYNHLLLTAYFMIPFVTLVCVRIMRACEDGGDARNKERLRDAFHYEFIVSSLAVSLLVSSTGIYYAFFSCFFYVVVEIYVLFQRKKSLYIVPLLCIGVVIVGVLLNYLPGYLFSFQVDSIGDTQSSSRFPYGAEYYSFSLTTLLFPRVDHRSDVFADLASTYQETTSYFNENESATLGLIGSIGFFVLVCFLFRLRKRNDTERIKIVTFLAALSVAAVLLGVISGFGTFLSYLIGNALIRGYNRISVFIGFFVLATVALLLTEVFSRGFQRYRVASHIGVTLLSLFLVVFGVWDQTVTVFHSESDLDAIRVEVNADRSFIGKIEGSVAEGSYIYELPYSAYPYGPEYPLLKGYIFSETLHWSYGGINNSDADIWNRAVSTMPAAEMVDYLVKEGYAGIYVDLDVYKTLGLCDSSVSRAADLPICRELEALVVESIESENSSKIFYSFNACAV